MLDALHPRHDASVMWVSVREGDFVHKITRENGRTFTSSVFDLARDPTETTDLYDAGNPDHRRVADELAAYKDALAARYADGSDAGIVSDERALELLRGLGYVE